MCLPNFLISLLRLEGGQGTWNGDFRREELIEALNRLGAKLTRFFSVKDVYEGNVPTPLEWEIIVSNLQATFRHGRLSCKSPGNTFDDDPIVEWKVNRHKSRSQCSEPTYGKTFKNLSLPSYIHTTTSPTLRRSYLIGNGWSPANVCCSLQQRAICVFIMLLL